MGLEYFVFGSPRFNDFLKENPHERGELSFLGSILEDGVNAIDIGANVGITTVAIARQIGGGKVYSFEPVRQYADILRENISFNDIENASLYEMAVTAHKGFIDFYEDGLSSGIVPKEGAKKFKVPTITIDDFLRSNGISEIGLINMDCEGSELLALRGAKETLSRNKIQIFCEIHQDFLKQLGHSVKDVVTYLKNLQFKVQSVSLDGLRQGSDFDKCDYIYAQNTD